MVLELPLDPVAWAWVSAVIRQPPVTTIIVVWAVAIADIPVLATATGAAVHGGDPCRRPTIATLTIQCFQYTAHPTQQPIQAVVEAQRQQQQRPHRPHSSSVSNHVQRLPRRRDHPRSDNCHRCVVQSNQSNKIYIYSYDRRCHRPHAAPCCAIDWARTLTSAWPRAPVSVAIGHVSHITRRPTVAPAWVAGSVIIRVCPTAICSQWTPECGPGTRCPPTRTLWASSVTPTWSRWPVWHPVRSLHSRSDRAPRVASGE